MTYTSFAPNWSAINRLGKSPVLRSSYFWLLAVPLLAKLLLKVAPEIQIPFWGTTITITLGLPFSWKMFYLSAVGFAIASFVYSVKCPSIIRDYDRFSDFYQEGKGGRQLVGAIFQLVRRRWFLFYSRSFEQGAWLEAFLDRYCEPPSLSPDAVDDMRRNAEWYQLLDLSEIPRSKLADAFWAVRAYADTSTPLARLACAVFYLTAFLFILIILAQNFLYVWKFVV